MAKLASRLNLPEAVGLSLAVIAPTVTAAFNITLVVQATGPAAPLTFAIGAVAMTLVALSFMAFTRRVAHAGSAYAYITHTFGRQWGFVAGWTLLLTYLGFATGFAALVGSFTSAALQGFAINIGSGWVAIGGGSMLLAWWLAHRDMRLSGWLMLVLEAAAVLGIIGLCVAILYQVHPAAQGIQRSFRPSAAFGGWTGMGFGMVFSILCYAGFEGAATLGEETHHPRRNIPIALLGTVLASGIFFVFVAYCEVIGFGPRGIRDLANSQAPLNDLALRYASPKLAIALDLMLLQTTILWSSFAGGVKVWDAATLAELRSWRTESAIQRLTPSGDGKLVATGGSTIELWDAMTGARVRGVGSNGDRAAGLAFSSDSKALLSCGDDSTVRLWDVETGKPGLVINVGKGGAFLRASLSADGRFIAGAGGSSVQMWDAVTGARLPRPRFEDGASSGDGVAFAPAGSLLAVSRYGSAVLQDAAARKIVHAFPADSNGRTEFAFSPDGKTVAVFDNRWEMSLWDVASGKPRFEPSPNPRPERILAVAASPDGRWVVTGSFGGPVTFWDTRTGQPRNVAAPGANDSLPRHTPPSPA